MKSRDTPGDASLLEADTSAALAPERAKQYKECTGRLLYLSHTRPDIQYSTCVLASKMSSPTVMAYKWLAKVAGYLQKVPSFWLPDQAFATSSLFGIQRLRTPSARRPGRLGIRNRC